MSSALLCRFEPKSSNFRSYRAKRSLNIDGFDRSGASADAALMAGKPLPDKILAFGGFCGNVWAIEKLYGKKRNKQNPARAGRTTSIFNDVKGYLWLNRVHLKLFTGIWVPISLNTMAGA
jgi:hypothetical protein